MRDVLAYMLAAVVIFGAAWLIVELAAAAGL